MKQNKNLISHVNYNNGLITYTKFKNSVVNTQFKVKGAPFYVRKYVMEQEFHCTF